LHKTENLTQNEIGKLTFFEWFFCATSLPNLPNIDTVWPWRFVRAAFC